MLPVVSVKNALSKGTNAFARAKERYNARREPARIGLIVDATGSRENTWERAQTIQARMFERIGSLRTLRLRLVHFGGGQLVDHGWQDDPRDLAARMAAVRCVTGLTQVLPALELFVDDAAEEHANTIILIGDAFEEESDRAERIAQVLAARKIRVFSFLEGELWAAEAVFKRLAEATGGRFSHFGSELSLSDLCEGVALLAAGGEKAVKRLPNKRVRQLLTGPAGFRPGKS